MTDDEIDELNDLYLFSDPRSFKEVHNFGEAVIEKWPAICRALRELNMMARVEKAPDTLTDLEMLPLEGET